MLICRAEDGISFEVPDTVRDIELHGDFDAFLQNVTGVPSGDILAYLSDGNRLTGDNFQQLIISPEQSIYVFNKSFLDLDFSEVLKRLAVLIPRFDEHKAATPSHILESMVTWIAGVVTSLKFQFDALRIATTSLDLNVLSISDPYEAFADTARIELQKQKDLLNNIDNDLNIISKVKIHPDFLPAFARRGQEAGDRPRMLGDYVSNTKMKQVANNCTQLHADLESRFTRVDEAFRYIVTGSNTVREAASEIRFMEDAERLLETARSVYERSMEQDTSHPTHESLTLLAQTAKEICDLKNSATEQCMHALREISNLNADLVSLPATLTILQADFRTRNSFNHIERLHRMLFAYGATLIEIVRRKEFGATFGDKANGIAEMLAKISAMEKKRRQIYRGDIQHLMPFDIRGMDDKVPSVELSLSFSTERQYSLDRSDIEAFLSDIDKIQLGLTCSPDNEGVERRSLENTKDGWRKLISRMDTLESSIDRAAERALLSASRVIRRSAILDHPAYEEIARQLRELQSHKADMEAQFTDHRHSLEDEIDRLRDELADAIRNAGQDQHRADQLEAETSNLRQELDSEQDTREALLTEQAKLRHDGELLQQAVDDARAEARSKTREADALRFELTQLNSDYQELKNLQEHNSSRVAALLGIQEQTLRNLEETRARGENLETQIQAALAEGNEARRALQEVNSEKERLLRAQASEHDRRLRDHIAEADGDRAILEQQFFQMRTELEKTRSELDLAHARLHDTEEELQRTSQALDESKDEAASAAADLDKIRILQSDTETRLEKSQRLVAEMLQVAISYRQALGKAMTTAQIASAYPPKQQNNLGDSVILAGAPSTAMSASTEDIPHIDPTDPETALDILHDFDLDICAETLAKPISVLRKWQKQCKDYRERAKSKITFRNFAKGDLALFLPIKNSQHKPWAAFNVAFPHYFLQASGHIAEQLKTREWIVARIVSITERIASHQNPETNPYGLSDGIKFYMCQVEDWTQPATKRANSIGVSKANTLMTSDDSSPNPSSAKVVAAKVPLPTSPHADPEDGVLEPSPGSHLFPHRSPSRAGPSSLKKLLAQAPLPDTSTSDNRELVSSPPDDEGAQAKAIIEKKEAIEKERRTSENDPDRRSYPVAVAQDSPTPVDPSPPSSNAVAHHPTSPLPIIHGNKGRQSPREPTHSASLTNHHGPSASPPRGSFRSRASSSSTRSGRRFLAGVPSPLSASPKAVATIALSKTTSRTHEEEIRAPSPAGSAGEGMLASVRRRVNSEVGPSPSTGGALSGLARTLGRISGRTTNFNGGNRSPVPPLSTTEDSSVGSPGDDVNRGGASDLLRRLGR